MSTRRTIPFTCAAVGCILLSIQPLAAQPIDERNPSGLEAALALEEAMVAAVAKAEKSVVAIARVPRGERADFAQLDPQDPDFVPTEFATGLVIDPRGLILTTAHVLSENSGSRYFVWWQRRPYPARVKAADPWTDLAVLEIEAEGLTPVSFGDPAKLRKGQFVLALGNPYALARDGEPSVSWGIVSNLARPAPPPAESSGAPRRKPSLHHYGSLIQTDIRLHRGTSGGALLNLHGEVVGLTTSLAVGDGFEEGIGFAIPIDEATRAAIKKLAEGQTPEFGFLGVAPSHLLAEERRAGRFGARIDQVIPGTPAADSGLLAGDVITAVDGRHIHDANELIGLVSRLPVESQVQLTLRRTPSRGDRDLVFDRQVALSKKYVESLGPVFAEVEPPLWRGLRIDYATATPRLRELLVEIDPAGCVAVLEVQRDSAAWKAGLRPGMFISHVQGARVSRPRDFFAQVAVAEGEVTIRLSRPVNGSHELAIAP